jgi:hypothetical protein
MNATPIQTNAIKSRHLAQAYVVEPWLFPQCSGSTLLRRAFRGGHESGGTLNLGMGLGLVPFGVSIPRRLTLMATKAEALLHVEAIMLECNASTAPSRRHATCLCSSHAAFFLRGPRAFGCCLRLSVVAPSSSSSRPRSLSGRSLIATDFAVPGRLADIPAAARGARLLSVKVMG